MRLYCLSDDPNLPCFILTVYGRSILLDFPLPIDHLLDYLPIPSPGCVNRFSSLPKYKLLSHNKENNLPRQIDELRILHNQLFVYSPIEFYTLDSSQYDFSLIDIILISNYETLLALPYLFKKYENLNAQIYLTEPTYRFGQQLMYEMVSYVEQQSKMIQTNDEWKYDPDIFDSIEEQQNEKKLKLFSHAQKLMSCYSIENVDKCLSHVTIVHFNEQIDLYSSIRASAISSGYCLGSCNWQLDINVNHNQTSKIETSSSQSNLTRFIYMSSSTTLETYSTKFSYDSFLNCDYLLLSNLCHLSSMDASINATELTAKIENILNDHGSVLIPCSSTGLIYDMFEFLTKYFEQINLLNIHMYFISPISNANLAISNAMSEWVTEQRQTASFSGTPPFKHNELIKSKCLITISSDRLDDTETLINFEQPSIIFTGHLSLRFGPVVQLIEKMKTSSSNGIIFIDNQYSYVDALKPYQPINMKCFYLPIDTRLNFSQVNILLNEKIRPKNLIVHEQYLNDIVKNDKINILSYRKYDNIKLPSINRYFINGQLNIKSDIKPKLIPTSNLAIASIHGHLDMCDYVYDINELDNENSKQNNLITYGKIDVDKFLINLSKSGIFGLEVKQLNEYDNDVNDNEQSNRSVEIKYNQGAAKIIVRSKQTDIECNDPSLMNKIRDALLMNNIGTL
ncbi:unnamed protein product [Rotaria socialis]|uniref:Beta-Casp domain-containing protein n=1 Tax=Rotaria socialis TaxID=392032 RepID=A0A821EYS8_9BILA|nr:unnamed protein product [Rotaria socialis]CAF3473754.1 unnamed protein product [Rotaria socialis]CAF3521966.1 unnamed protein product [Rotaria socialis]CAF4283212.1 unnamed protein product [Rotaria socialis]CAF4360608.1 unnamed protein product [Rotaria socialis]